jgi:hypothetical protein
MKSLRNIGVCLILLGSIGCIYWVIHTDTFLDYLIPVLSGCLLGCGVYIFIRAGVLDTCHPKQGDNQGRDGK